MAAGKRQATTDLNHDNWDQEEKPEEAGTFQVASKDELKNRVIKKARRKIGDASDPSSTNKSVFSGFSGFGKAAAPTAGSGSTVGAASPFSFLSKIPSVNAANSSSGSGASAVPATPTFSFGATASTTKSINAKEVESDFKKANKEPEKSSGKSDIYYAKLKGLNQAVSDWIKTHVDKNQLCILSPIFKDYEKYLNEIQKDECVGATTVPNKTVNDESKTGTTNTLSTFKFSTSPVAPTTISTAAADTPNFSFGSSSSLFASPTATTATSGTSGLSTNNKSTSIFGGISKPTAPIEAQKSNGFSFGLKSEDKAGSSAATASATPGFSFGKVSSTADSADDKKTTAFSFKAGASPFTFANIQSPSAPAAKPVSTEEEDEEDKPPKVEFKQVVEEDAIYSIKCKLYIKKDGNFVERGVGTLYLKPVKDTEKTQLLVRADTNLGNILANLILNSALPTKRMGKNNVMLICLPTPDVDKPTSMLLRVKTGEEADELFEAIEKYKK